MAASAIEAKNLRTQRSTSQSSYPPTSVSIEDNNNEDNEGSSSGTGTNRNFSSNLSFHPLKSYKTGKITESNLSMEIGPVFGTDSSSKNNNYINFLHVDHRNGLLDNKPIRGSKSTLDLPSLAQQEEFRVAKDLSRKTRSEDRSSYQIKEGPKIRERHRSATSVSPIPRPRSFPDADGNASTGDVELDGNYLGVKKERKKRSFKLRPKLNREKATTQSPSLSPNSPKKGRSSPRGAPEITVDKYDDDNEQEEEDDEEPRIGSLEWCRLRTGSTGSSGSALSGLVCAGEIGPAIAVGLNIGSSIVTSNGISISGESVLLRDGNLITVPVLPMEPSDSSDAEGELLLDSDNKIPKIPVVVTLPQGISAEVSDGAESIIVPVCPVDHTKGKEVMNAVIPCNIDQLFTMLFTNSTFYLDFQVKRKTSDINQTDWQLGDGSQKSRQLTFTVVTGQTIGPRQAHVTETQTLLPASTPGLLYAIQSESVNSGIPYADCFSVNCHFCLTKLSETESNMVVIGKIQYKKSTWARTFIEKNSMSAMGDHFAALEKALKEECAKMNAGGVTPTSPIVGANLSRRRHPRKKMRAPDIPASAMNRPIEEQRKMVHAAVGRGGTLPSSASEAMSDAVMDGVESSLVMKVILVVLGCLLLLNAFLYYKLSSLETAANMSVLYPPTIRFTGEAPQSHQEWLMLLQQQESLHISEINSWHEVLISAIKILHQAEKDLESLKSHISTYGKGNIAIVANPPTDGTIGATRTSQTISNEKNLNQNVDQRNINTSKNSDSSDTGADVTRDREKGKEK